MLNDYKYNSKEYIKKRCINAIPKEKRDTRQNKTITTAFDASLSHNLYAEWWRFCGGTLQYVLISGGYFLL